MCGDGSRVVPVEEEESEGTHDEEEEDPHAEARIVLHCLENKMADFQSQHKGCHS